MPGPDLCPKCKGLHFKTAPCIVRKPSAGSSNGRTAPFDGVNAGSTPAPASTPPKRPRGRPRIHPDRKAYKAAHEANRRAKLKEGQSNE